MARIQKVYKEVVIVLKKAQEEIKQQVDKRQKEVEKWNKRDKMILSIKNLVFKERLARKLTEQYVGLVRRLALLRLFSSVFFG